MKFLNTKHKNNGSAIILVIILLMLLATVGFMFVMVGRLDSIGSNASQQSQELDSAVDNLLDWIGDEIAADADPGALGYGYDYPDNTHRWLANIEPYFDAAEALSESSSESDYFKHYKWRQISNVLGALGSDKISVRDVHVQPEPDKSWSNATNLLRQTIDEYQEIVVAPSNKYEPNEDVDLQAKFANAPTEEAGFEYSLGYLLRGEQIGATDSYYGQWADADGDGVADSKWFRVPHLKTASGEYYYAAVRIIDNSGMVNVNTAYSDGRADNYTWSDDYLFYGDCQLSINLEGLINSDDDIEDFFNFRGLEDWSGAVEEDDWYDYRDNVVLRLSNPEASEDRRVFGIADELALRNRFCINGGYNTRLELALANTLNGTSWTDGWGYRYRPYMGGEYGTLMEWCLAITGEEQDNPDRRHLLTTMSKSRELAPVQIEAADLATEMEVIPGRRKAYINTVDETVNNEALTIEQLAGNIYYAIKGQDFKPKFGDYITNERIAWNFALNIVDYQDENSIPSVKQVGNKTYFGFEGIDGFEAMQEDALIVSGMGYYDNSLSAKPVLNPEKFYAITIYNPATDSKRITNLNNYILTVFDSGGNEKYKIDIYRDILNSINTDIPGESVLSIANIADTGADHRAFSGAGEVDIKYNHSQLAFEEDDVIIIHKVDWPHGNMNMPVDRSEVALPMTNVGALESAQRQTEIGFETGILLGNKDSWTLSVGGVFDDVPTIAESIEVSLGVQNAPINIGELGNVFAIGAYADSGNPATDMTFVDAFEEARALNETSSLKNWGRFDFHIDNDITAALFDYLTVFNISWDGIDTDGNLLTSDKPDKVFDELEARDYETVIDGRININTAPPLVLAQLPFMTEELAAIVSARRDGQILYDPTDFTDTIANYSFKTAGFRNIAQILDATIDPVMNVNYDEDYDIWKFGQDGDILDDYPDYYPDDIEDDYKERDIVFQRISNNIDVRSDVFTAYILIRDGATGSQKRLIVTYDRSNVYKSSDKPKRIVREAFLLGR